MAENIEEAFERRFYTTNKSTRINLYDNDLFLLTKAVDPRYRLDFFPANLKQKVVRLLKSKVKNLVVKDWPKKSSFSSIA